jgi:hypothetical protein
MRGTGIALHYWLDRNREVDFVLSRGQNVTAIEVKSGSRRVSIPGMEAFSARFPVTRRLLVGAQGVPLPEFLAKPAAYWLE